MRKKLFLIILAINIIILSTQIAFINKTSAKGIDGTTIVINPGHGGRDSGAINNSVQIMEKDLNLKISNYLRDYLNQYYNVKIIMTHDGINFPNNNEDDLAARAMVARNNNADLYVSVHVNSINNNSSINGANVYVTSRTELPKYKEGMTILGNKILNNLAKLGIKNQGVINNKLCNDREPKYQYYDGSQADYYADIRCAMKGDSLSYGQDFRDGSGIPTVLIEHCYLSSNHDLQFIDSDDDLRKLAKADCDAIVDYFELKLKSEIVTQINVDNENINLVVGESKKIIANTYPNNVTEDELIWESSNAQVATVDSKGNIESIAEGTSQIKVYAKNNPNAFKIIYLNVEQEQIKIENSVTNILVGNKRNLKATITPSWLKNEEKQITWISDNPEVVDVNSEGEIEAKSEGTATITALWNQKDLRDSITITAIKVDEEISIEIKDYTVEKNNISKIGSNISKEEFEKNLILSDNLSYKIQKQNEEQAFIGTGTKLIIEYNEMPIEEYECLIYGDVNGDGKISSLDYTLIKNHIMDVRKIKGNVVEKAADVNGDEKISSLDYTLIKNHIMEIKMIDIK